MHQPILNLNLTGALALAIALGGPASADKPADPGGDRANPEEKTLPSRANDKAHERGFGQRGAEQGRRPDGTDRMRKADGSQDKALPDQASDRAREVAFGQQGLRQRAQQAAQAEVRAEVERAERTGVLLHGANSKSVGPGSERGASQAARAGERPGPPANLDAVRNTRAAGNGRPADAGRPERPGQQGRGR